MAELVMVLGESGSGKSASLRNFNKNEVLVINVSGKRLPFKTDINSISLRHEPDALRYQKAKAILNKYEDKVKSFVIDDSQFLMAFELFNRATEKGYDKFTQIAQEWVDFCNYIQSEVSDDVIVYLMHHTEYDSTSGKTKSKTIGKMVDQYISPESLCTIVLGAFADDSGYWFSTKTDGSNTIKTPIGMFADEKIENDLKNVDSKIREYYGIKKG